MAKGVLYNQNGVLIYRLWEEMPAAPENQAVPLSVMPPGAYRLALLVNQNITGSTTTVGNVVSFLDQAQTLVAQAAAVFNLNSPNDSIANPGGLLTLAPATPLYRGIAPNGTAGMASSPMVIPWGVRVSLVSLGTATAGQKFLVDLVACRVDPVVIQTIPSLV